MMRIPPPRKWERLLWPVLTVALLLLLWHEAVKWSGTKVLPSPREVARGAAELWRSGGVIHCLASLARIELPEAIVGKCIRRIFDCERTEECFAVGKPLASSVGFRQRRVRPVKILVLRNDLMQEGDSLIGTHLPGQLPSAIVVAHERMPRRAGRR